MTRVTELIMKLEQDWQEQNVLLVAHGDVLQILQTAFALQPVGYHRRLSHLNTAEIRQLTLCPGT